MAGVLWREYKDYADVKEITMAFAKATIAQQVALRDALVKTEQLVQRAAIGSGSAADQGAAIDTLITALETAIAAVKAAA